MKVSVLVDNSMGANPELIAEHGLSFYIEAGEWRILCDMGASGAFARNAQALGIDLSTTDFAFISHGHNDHAGGLKTFFETCPDKRVYLSGQIMSTQYFSTRRGIKRDISPDFTTMNSNRDRLIPLFESCRITQQIAFVHPDNSIFPVPYGNSFLYSSEVGSTNVYLDNFQHEFALAIYTPKGLVIVAPCSHCGAANIVQAAKQYTGIDKVYAYIGGLHFVDSDVVEKEVDAFVRDFYLVAPNAMLYTGHCTGEMAKELLLKSMPNVKLIETGLVIDI